jgi:hypothetical protein
MCPLDWTTAGERRLRLDALAATYSSKCASSNWRRSGSTALCQATPSTIPTGETSSRTIAPPGVCSSCMVHLRLGSAGIVALIATWSAGAGVSSPPKDGRAHSDTKKTTRASMPVRAVKTLILNPMAKLTSKAGISSGDSPLGEGVLILSRQAPDLHKKMPQQKWSFSRSKFLAEECLAPLSLCNSLYARPGCEQQEPSRPSPTLGCFVTQICVALTSLNKPPVDTSGAAPH